MTAQRGLLLVEGGRAARMACDNMLISQKGAFRVMISPSSKTLISKGIDRARERARDRGHEDPRRDPPRGVSLKRRAMVKDPTRRDLAKAALAGQCRRARSCNRRRRDPFERDQFFRSAMLPGGTATASCQVEGAWMKTARASRSGTGSRALPARSATATPATWRWSLMDNFEWVGRIWNALRAYSCRLRDSETDAEAQRLVLQGGRKPEPGRVRIAPPRPAQRRRIPGRRYAPPNRTNVMSRGDLVGPLCYFVAASIRRRPQ